MAHGFPVLKFRLLLLLVAGQIISIEAIRLFEGDMVFSAAQREAAEQGRVINFAVGRATSKYYLWPSGIVPFSIEKQLKDDPLASQAINDAMKQWSSYTCVTFKERATEKAFIYFFIGGSCFSEVGRTGEKQYISLAPHCWSAGHVAHEIAHALGFYHEQSRPDRDEYVTINWNNIVESEKINFAKYGPSRIDSLGVPYGYKSLMHFGESAFSKNGQPTITPKQEGATIGQRDRPSDLDVKRMNLLYKCNGGGGGNGGGNGGGGGGGGGGSGGGGGGGESCKDFNNNCGYWAGSGECNRNPGYMRVYCKKSCRVCVTQGGCTDRNQYCNQWATMGYCYTNPGYMKPNCKRSCGICYG